MKRTERPDRDTIEYKPREYVSVGPVRVANPLPEPEPSTLEEAPVSATTLPPPLTERLYPYGVERADRVSGWLYDAHTGVVLGIASYELRDKHGVGVVFTRMVGGCKQDLEIQP